MVHQSPPIDIASLPELAALVDEVCRSGRTRVLRRGGEDIALLTPLPARKRRTPGAAPAADRLWDLVGIGESVAHEDVGTHKHGYLADAAQPGHERPGA